MPVRMLNFVKNPPPARTPRYQEITACEEWQDLVLALGAGLKPQEYISINFPPEHKIRSKVKFPNVAFLRATKKKIKELGLPYDAYERAGAIYVVGRGVLS